MDIKDRIIGRSVQEREGRKEQKEGKTIVWLDAVRKQIEELTEEGTGLADNAAEMHYGMLAPTLFIVVF